jgi:tetratricopeptide (TPR) repeat protein
LLSSSNTPDPRRPLKGSWEAMFQEAHDLARRDDDRALAHYWRLVDRLANFPMEQRQKGQGKLQILLEDALLSGQAYLAKRGRFREAQEFFLDRIDEFLSGEFLADWHTNRARLLSWTGEFDAAIELLQPEVRAWPLNIATRWLLFDLYVETGRPSDAAVVVDDLEALLHVYPVAPDEEEDSLSLHRSLVFYLRSALALDRQAWEEAYNLFRRAADESEAYNDSWHMLYRPLIFRDQREWANRVLNRERSEVSQRFWRGLNGHYAGDKVGSRVEWQSATNIDIDQIWVRSAGDWILAHYYLGDEKRQGLELALRLISRQQGEPEPIMLLLAGLGWAIRDDWVATRTNLGFALAQYRANLQGALLPEMYWFVARDLVGVESFAEIEQYFHRPKWM